MFNYNISEDDQCDGVSHMPNGTIHSQKSHRTSTMGPRPPGTVNGLSLDLPVDDEDYLMPSPQSPFHVANNNNHVTNTYMDLLSDPKGSSNMFQYPPPQNYFLTGKKGCTAPPSLFFLRNPDRMNLKLLDFSSTTFSQL
jgi:hypothetical protein